MIKKTICALAAVLTLLVGAGAADASSAFPAVRTGADGVTLYGYLDESGQTVLPFVYTKAGEFADCGLAAVEDEKWQTGVINRQGKLIVPYTDAPISVDFSSDAIAYRYADRSVYYTLSGELIGSYAGAEGFFADGLLLCKSPASGLYGYVKADGTAAFSGSYKSAGSFSGGRAVVEAADGSFSVIDTTGAVVSQLERFMTPSYLTIYGEGTLIVSDGSNQALYSIITGQYLTDFICNRISEFHEGAAMVRQINRWGLIDENGRVLTKPAYYYLSYMGEGLYAARSEDGSAAAVDASGNVVYRTPEYVGGFSEIKYGLSWHGMSDGSLIFFRRNGGFAFSLKNAEQPRLLTENIVRVTQNGEMRYINLATGQTVYAPQTSFDLGSGLAAKSVRYEKFLGYQKDGTEHGWNVTFPEISGMADTAVQKQINAAIRDFFLKGPSVTAEYEALEGTYGVSLEGSVLVVSANCVSGKGQGSVVWNNNLAFDLNTGKQYQLSDLLGSDYLSTVRSLLPAEHAIYLYSFPRISTAGVTYFYNEYESSTRRAYTERYLLSFEQLGDAVNRDSACFQALLTPYQQNTAAVRFTDVSGHWAEPLILRAAERGLVQGSDGRFRPDDAITYAEVCTTVARSRSLTPATVPAQPGYDPNAWYAEEVGAAYTGGLLTGLWDGFSANAAVTREDAMQLFANVLLKDGKTALPSTRIDSTLSAFSDAAQLSANRRAAAALCVQQALIQGSDGRIDPQSILTRAQFVKLLLLV